MFGWAGHRGEDEIEKKRSDYWNFSKQDDSIAGALSSVEEVRYRHLIILVLYRPPPPPSYIQKAGVLGVRTPQIILIFRKVIVWDRKNYKICSVEFRQEEQ